MFRDLVHKFGKILLVAFMFYNISEAEPEQVFFLFLCEILIFTWGKKSGTPKHFAIN
jgi:hypothetical protein